MHQEEEEGSSTQQLRVPWYEAQQASPKKPIAREGGKPLKTQRRMCVRPRVAPCLLLCQTVPRCDARRGRRHR